MWERERGHQNVTRLKLSKKDDWDNQPTNKPHLSLPPNQTKHHVDVQRITAFLRDGLGAFPISTTTLVFSTELARAHPTPNMNERGTRHES